MNMEHRLSGNLDDTGPSEPGPSEIDSSTWTQISIKSQSLDDFKWDVLCDERWSDVHKNSYECHRITRRAVALGGHLYAVATHIIPNNEGTSPSISESLIFVPVPDIPNKS